MTPSDRSREPLLKTKLSAPQLRASLVSRPRLLSLLADAEGHALTLICAPAGYGKTTLLTEWLSGFNYDKNTVCWLSLDEGDNDPGRFLGYLTSAFETVFSNLGDEIRPLLQTFPTPSIQTILAIIINELYSLTVPIYLVLDDYQFITNPSIHEGVTFLLDRLPEAMHLVIATRSDPPLSLARLRARNQLVEIRADQLRFNSAESAGFLQQVMQLSLSTDDISTLEMRTEGWAAGLQMAALSIKGRSDISQFIKTFSGSHRYILDYLAEETLNRQPEDVQHFLLTTSILDRLCGDLCDALIDSSSSSSQSILEYLVHANLFLIALDDERRWYRYHRLFADLLRARLYQSHQDRVPELHRLASGWFDRNHLPNQAVQHAFSANDYDRAAELIERYGPQRWSDSDPSIVQMAGSLPPEMLIARPKLGLYQAWFLIGQGHTQRAIPLLDDLAQHLAVKSPGPGSAWMLSVIALVREFITPPTSALGNNPLPDYHTLEDIPAQDLVLRNAADILYGMLLGRRGELNLAAEVLVKCIQREKTPTGSLAIPTAIPFLARIYLMQGQLHKAETLCREFLKPIQERGVRLIYTAGSMQIALGEVLYEWNHLDEAEEQIREGIQANKPWKNAVSDTIGYTALARVQEARGDLQAAFETARQIEEMFAERVKPLDLEGELLSLKVRLWLSNSDLAKAGEWADHFSKGDLRDQRQELDHLTLARVRLAQGKYVEAQEILETVDRIPGLENRINRKIKTSLLLAIALSGQELMPQALAVFETCLALGEADGHLRVFLDGKDAVRKILFAYLRSPAPIYRAYAQKLLDAFPGQPEGFISRNPRADNLDSFTPRERDVLQLMAEGYSNRQIAEKLILSEGTIKFYVHSILDKLQVHNRTQAIVQAKERNLI